MKMTRHATILSLAFASVLVLGACGKTEPPAPAPTPIPVPTAVPTAAPFRVTSVDLGKSIGDDKKIKDASATFHPKDPIYAAVSSEGSAAKATLKVRWTFGTKGHLVNEETRDIAPTGSAVTEFHVSKASGWPLGKYKVEVWADGASVATKDFEVTK